MPLLDERYANSVPPPLPPVNYYVCLPLKLSFSYSVGILPLSWFEDEPRSVPPLSLPTSSVVGACPFFRSGNCLDILLSGALRGFFLLDSDLREEGSLCQMLSHGPSPFPLEFPLSAVSRTSLSARFHFPLFFPCSHLYDSEECWSCPPSISLPLVVSLRYRRGFRSVIPGGKGLQPARFSFAGRFVSGSDCHAWYPCHDFWNR